EAMEPGADEQAARRVRVEQADLDLARDPRREVVVLGGVLALRAELHVAGQLVRVAAADLPAALVELEPAGARRRRCAGDGVDEEMRLDAPVGGVARRVHHRPADAPPSL